MQSTHNYQLPTVKNIVNSNKKLIIQGSLVCTAIGLSLLYLGCKLYSQENYSYFILGIPIIYILSGITGLWAGIKKSKSKTSNKKTILISLIIMNLASIGIFISILVYLFSNPWTCQNPNSTSCILTYSIYRLVIGGVFILHVLSIVAVVSIFVLLNSASKLKDNSMQLETV
ncbi:hypothetical protein SteCoe_25111 [Stentor coeruleus]|uniref:Uncharacterized protein n=1 Tax=Stentor coeruleus TaxID=5963 RepID=A0A1R2BFZ7_9CILI|nr:hypothetical protein SteCoe_25111 [Stentor coeruleus]